MAANTATIIFSKALELLQDSKSLEKSILSLRIRIERAKSFQIMGEISNSLKDFEEAIRLSNVLDDKKTALSCLCDIPWVIYNTSLKDKVPGYCDQAMTLAKSLNDTGAEASISANHAYWRHLWNGPDTTFLPLVF